MQRRYIATIATIAMLAGFAVVAPHAQTAGQKPQTQKPSEAPARAEPDNPVNIRIEVTITEASGQNAGAKRGVTLLTSDRQNGVIRSNGDVRVGDRFRPVAINVDARPTLVRDGMVRLELGLEYQPQGGGGEATEPSMWRVNERVTVVLQSNEPLVVSETFDPSSERRLTVEVKATILK